MDKNKVVGIIKSGKFTDYTDGFEYCKRVIRILMSLTGERHLLVNKQVEILGVMCKLCVEGREHMDDMAVMAGMRECGVEDIGYGTLRNYKSQIKRKGWIQGKRLRLELMKAINDGGLAVGVFYKDG